MNPKKNPTCVTDGFYSYGSCTGPDGCHITAFRIRRRNPKAVNPDHYTNTYFQKGTLDGVKVEGSYDERQAEITRLGLLYGYTHRYGRNTITFTMSRAARKRGYTVADFNDLRNATEGWNARTYVRETAISAETRVRERAERAAYYEKRYGTKV